MVDTQIGHGAGTCLTLAGSIDPQRDQNQGVGRGRARCASVYLDVAGSVIDDGTVEVALATLGADRLLFACDMSMTASVGRIRGAEIREEDRKKILGANMRRILNRRRFA